MNTIPYPGTTPVTSTEQPTADLPSRVTPRFNRAAMRRQALEVSRTTRAGKFTRVSEEFLTNLEAEIENHFRQLRAPLSVTITQVDPAEGEEFLTGAGKAELAEMFNVWIARRIHKAVHATRVGKTL